MDDIAMVVGILADALPVPVGTEIPPTRPQRMVCVSLTADDSTELLHHITVTLMVWGTSDVDARGLATSAVHALTDAAKTHDLLSSAELETMSRDEWTATGQARYLAQLDLIINV